MKKKNLYVAPTMKVLQVCSEGVMKDINSPGTEVTIPDNPGTGDAGGAASKSYSVWDNEEESADVAE